MAFTVEDGTGVTGANSYASTAEADSYWVDRGATSWAGASDPEKQAALIRATSFVDGRYFGQFLGLYPAKSAQSLQWPRVDAVDSRGYQITGIVLALKAAVCEAALLFLAEDLTAPQERGGQVKKVKFGPVEQEFADNAPAEATYPAIDMAIRPLLKSDGASGSGSVRIGRA